MKRAVLVLGFVTVCAAIAAAESYDDKVKNAVNVLASRMTSPLEVSIGGIYLDGTESQSGLSRNLHNKVGLYAVDTGGRFRVAARSRGVGSASAGGAQKGIIEGTFVLIGGNVEVTLRLVSDPGGRVLGMSQFTVSSAELDGIEILPSNFKTPEKVREQETIFASVPEKTNNPSAPPVSNPPPVNRQDFQITAWPNSDTNTYIDGDEFRITIEASRDCYFKVYHVDKDGTMQMIHPNQVNRNNQLQARLPRTIPDSGIRYNVEAPFGQDTIIVVASTRQFVNIEAEYTQVHQATSGSVADIMSGRGIGVQATGVVQPVQAGSVQDAETVSVRFNFTSLPSSYFDETYSYRKPADMASAIGGIRAEVIRQGGTFTGNEREGSYNYPGVEGRYFAGEDTITVRLRYTGNRLTVPLTRGVKDPYTFAIDRPRNIAQAVQLVRSGIEGQGGTFSGNEQSGSFRASGIAGQYSIADRVNVSISDKPALIPHSLIEKEVRSYFSGK